MRIKAKRISKSMLSAVLTVLMLLSCVTVGVIPTDAAMEDGSVGDYSAHFYLIGDGTPVGGWNKNGYYKLESYYGTNSYYINAKLTNNGFFALHNGSKRYAPNTDGTQVSVGSNFADAAYDNNENHAWQFTGATQVVRLVVNEASEWYPTMKIESPDWYISGYFLGEDRGIGSSDYKFTKISDSNYRYQFTSTGASQYITINDGKSCVYHAPSRNAGSGTVAPTPEGSETWNNDYKWKIDSTSGSLVTVTWDPTTWTLSWAEESQYTVTVQSENTSKGTVASGSVTARASEAVTLPTATPKTGYDFSTWSTTSTNITIGNATSANAATVTASAAGTVTANFTEITHSVAVKRRLYNSDGTVASTTNIETVSGVGIATTGTVHAGATVAKYTFDKFVFPTGVTLSGTGQSLTENTAKTINATADGKIVYIDYKETEHAITATVNNNTYGSIKKGNTAVSNVDIGEVTNVALSAVNATGYAFKEWVITKETGQTADKVWINDTEYSIPAAGLTVAKTTAGANSNFRFNGTATLQANFEAVPYSITATFAGTYSAGNIVSVNQDGNTIGSKFRIVVTLDDGYEIDSISGTGITSTMPTPGVSGSTYSYEYTLGAENVTATVALKAKKPEISKVQVRAVANDFAYVTAATSTEIPHYYGQPDDIMVTADSCMTSISITNGTNSAASATAVINAPSVTLSNANATQTYTITVTTTNSRTGVTAATDSKQFTVRVSYNAAQKKKLALNTKLERYFRFDGIYGHSYSSYYNDDLPSTTVTDYNNKYDAAKGFTAHYNTAESAVNTLESEFDAAVNALKPYAKKTTVYVMVKTEKASALKFHVWENGSADDWAHFRMLTSYDEGSYTHDDSNDVDYCKCTPVLKGSFKKTNDNDCKLYALEYYGNAKFIVYSGATVNDTTKLTGNITVTAAFKNYYIDCYNASSTDKNLGASDEYVDFGIKVTSDNKKWVDAEAPQTKADLKRLLDIECVGSPLTSPQTKYTDVEFKIEGPGGGLWNLNNDTDTFPASTHGKYTLTYSVKFDSTANSTDYTREISKTFWVAYEEIAFYADMNDNVGNPILKFKYYLDNNGNPTSEETENITYLPCEMELVSGSESIYKYAVNLKKLRETYKITLSAEKPINISSISVENVDYNNGGDGFDILDDARLNGEAWFKADSTHLKGFDIISYGSVNRKFLAVNENDNNAVLAGGVNKISGTGIVSDFDDIYNTRYAGLFSADGAAAPMNDFHYVLGVRMNEEFSITTGSGQSATVTKYYFDKWVKLSNCDEVPVTSDGVSLEGAEDYSDKADLNFTKAPDYLEGNEAYVALYKAVTTGDSTVRLEITYNFEDYNTTDGNYVYDPNKGTVNASYTKTVKVPVGAGQTYADFDAVNNETAVKYLANVNAPFISSNYYEYEYDDTPDAAHALTYTAVENESKIKVNAHIRKKEREYEIKVSYGGADKSHTGRFQQTVALKASEFTGSEAVDGSNNFYWTDNNGNVIAVGGTFNARYFYNDDSGNPEIIKLVQGSGSVTNSSVIVASYTEKYDEGTTNMLRHNFMIIDHCGKGKLVGGGVLFATGSYSNASDPATWSYRRQSAETNLADSSARENFISGILNGDYETEYPVQTISNIGFRYAPDNEEIFRWSDNLKAYLTQFEGTNINSPNYTGQKLRMFSFMVYNNGTDENPDYVVESSEGFAEVSRYVPQS